METEWSQQYPEVPRAKRRSRVQAACARCRRQKLKCDNERPCSLCVRSEVPCISDNRPRKRRALSSHSLGQVPGPSPPHSLKPRAPALQLKQDPSPSSFNDRRDHDPKSASHSHSASTPQQPESSGVDETNSAGSEPYNQRTSAAGLTQEIIENFSPETILESSTSALPGGVHPRGQEMLPLSQIVGFDLPPKQITDYFLQNYLDAVHWFMMVFHAPTLRSSYETLLATRTCPRSRSNHVIFILLLLSLGAQYTNEDNFRQRFPNFDLTSFRTKSLERVEASLNSLYDSAELEAVQVCVILGSYYMYHGRPNLSFVVLGAGLRCSQLMSLHRESSWRWLPEMAKEERRRTFWALFVFDRFAATVFGHPCGIPLSGIEVKIPENMGDTNIQHPAFRSTAVMPDGKVEPVTTFAYTKYKFKLYQISSPIIGDLYFHRSSDVFAVAAKVSKINDDLVAWFNSLPPELKLEDLFRKSNEPPTSETRPFVLQALALQIAYDNVQILLHRPLLSQDLQNFKSSTASSDSEEQVYPIKKSSPAKDIHKILVRSRDHCWDSAIRSSKLGQFHQCLVVARESHAAAFLGINLFTAGMVLCVVALSRPLSSQAQIAKQAIARIMSISRFLSGRALLSAQTSKILKDLVRLIGEKEIKAMLSGPEMQVENTPGPKTQPPGLPDASVTADLNPPNANGQSIDAEQAQPLGFGNGSMMRQPASTEGYTPNAFAASSDLDFSGFESLDFNNGISTLQAAMFPTSTVASPSANAAGYMNPPSRDQYNSEHTYLNHMSGSEDSLLGSVDFNIMNTVGQTWLWDGDSW